MAAIDAGLERVSRTRRKRQDLLIETTPLRVRDTGSRVWVFQYKYGKKHNRMKLGTWPVLSLEKARGKARKYREDVDRSSFESNRSRDEAALTLR
jgi:Arm DNA-binding domain